ncbi:DNA translocase FtsK [Catenovulum adriaticum]|uniref:DNA translocase FtsK n=1 Tax=Catenovulum adriaticum TaxID=2984846 RepID=A0ABY7AMK0_9ALTE|nr:DNA translocase FtsK [Catenovulum sp. TS8]WAJ70788.1 DNA translocase FtsK 4TM domain-containing protein [Catenovulum sp. TS8]
MNRIKPKQSLTGIQRLLEVGLITSAGCALFILISLISFNPLDPSWSQSGYNVPIHNLAGAAGAWLSDLLFFFLGFVAYLVPIFIAFIGWAIFQQKPNFFEIDYLALGLRVIGFVLLLISSTSLSSLNFVDLFDYSSGGLLGDLISQSMLPYFNFVGTTLLLLCFFCTGITLLFGVSWLYLVDKTGEYLIFGGEYTWQKLKAFTQGEFKASKESTEDEAFVIELNDDEADKKQAKQKGVAKLNYRQDKQKVESNSESNDAALANDFFNQFANEPTDEPEMTFSAEASMEADRQQHADEKPSGISKWLKRAKPSKSENETQQNKQADEKRDLNNDFIEPVIGDLPEVDDDDMQTRLPLGQQQGKQNDSVSAVQETSSHVVSSKQASQDSPYNQAQPSAQPKANTSSPTSNGAAQEQNKKPLSPAHQQLNELIQASMEKEQQPTTVLPSFELLDRPDKAQNPITQEEMDAVSALVEAKLLDFGVQAKVMGMYPGPVITRLELDLAPGVKVSKITNLSKDIARSLSAVSVRVVEVIPGKSYVGLELPNKHREIVRLSEVIEGHEFDKAKSPLTMVLGQDIAGKPVVVDLAKMPHLLVAGTTGSGKSVGVNVMILSLLYKSTPEDVRLIMIDPKMLELSVYEGIPHLLCEVVTDMKEASNALRWCVGEMERRYKLMSALGVRNMKGYNTKINDAIENGNPIRDPLWKPGDSMDEEAPFLEKLPAIVVVIDEFADMMMIVGKKVEELIARIAQKARAAGIHLVLATQRPSVDVITGLIKANIPTRMAFQVSSKIDSRTILDQQGAETLLGMGDMLYLPSGTGVPTRVHGAFVDDHEVHAVVADWKDRGTPVYIDGILNGDSSEETLLPGEQAEMMADEESDPIYDEAVAFVTETRKVSVSSVQRKFRIGYNRAARIVEQMEATGVVTTAGHNGAREVLAPPPPKLD